MKGAGRIGQFVIGFIMMLSGFYLLLNAISVTSLFTLDSRVYEFSVFGGYITITSAMVMIPCVFSIAMILYNYKNTFAWLLAILSISALIFAAITAIDFTFKSITASELITILVLVIGGIGLFLRSLKAI
ncbi:MAG: hypothetical protein OQK77_00950 [Psychromonas sp.]|nr:hypothetical protein [Psychromonas sp.]